MAKLLFAVVAVVVAVVVVVVVTFGCSRSDIGYMFTVSIFFIKKNHRDWCL